MSFILQFNILYQYSTSQVLASLLALFEQGVISQKIDDIIRVSS